MKNIFLIILSFLLIVSCKELKKNGVDKSAESLSYPQTINIKEGIVNATELKLSDIADSINYIILSKDKNVLIKGVYRLHMSDKEIYTISEGRIVRFDISGKYLNDIGKIGRGPNEYFPNSKFAITPSLDNILVIRQTTKDYLMFKNTGEYIRKKNLNLPLNIYDFDCVSDSSFLFTCFFSGSFMKKDVLNSLSGPAGIFDNEGNPIDVIENPLDNKSIHEHDLSELTIPNPTFSYFDNKIVLSPKGDTIYEIIDETIVPGFIFNWGSISHEESFEDLYLSNNQSSNRMVNHRQVFETISKVYFRCGNIKDSFIFEYDKVTGSCRSMALTNDISGFINDIDGGGNFYPVWNNRSGDIWIDCIDAYGLSLAKTNSLIEKSGVVNPRGKAKFNDFIKNLKPDDNPVLRIVYLKKK